MKLIPEVPESKYWMGKGYENPAVVAKFWESWCGITPWSKYLREFGELGGLIKYWGGVPQSASAIPLCFELLMPVGDVFPGGSRLKDIRAAVASLK